jgi:hypothetical protein
MAMNRAGKPGRKPKTGERYPNGRLKPSAEALALRRPNPKVLAERRALLGAPGLAAAETRMAENPLDCLGARGWLSAELVRAGHAYAELHRRAGLRQARTTLIADDGAPASGVETASLAEMTPEEIARVWAAVEQRGPGSGAGEGDPEAAARLKLLWRRLGPAACAELHSVCLMQSWPFWAMQKVCGREEAAIPEKWLRRRRILADGLQTVRDALRPQRPPSPPVYAPQPRAPLRETLVRYVDEDGRDDPVRNGGGVEVEVVRRRRA